MKKIYYIGYYCGQKTGKRVVNNTNLAGTLKMQFVIRELRQLGYEIVVISVAPDARKGLRLLEKVAIDENENHIYLPSLMFNIKGKIRGTKFSRFFLWSYIKKNIRKEDTVISYHSFGYSDIVSKLHKKIGYKWIPQIEEIYCLSRGEKKDLNLLKKEESMFINGDGYLFVNDLLPTKYANGKPYAVSYGNYQIFDVRGESINEQKINITYTGIINNDRGVFLLLDAIRLLPDNYQLNVLGFGTDENMKRFHDISAVINKSAGYNKVVFWGTRSGEEYSKFLSGNDIGISLMDTDSDISSNAFPSKIMSYLGHSLYVVSSKVESIQSSKVAPLLYFCDNTPMDIAKVIQTIPSSCKPEWREKLEHLEQVFLDDLKGVIES